MGKLESTTVNIPTPHHVGQGRLERCSNKKVLYVDMDNVLVNFQSGIDALNEDLTYIIHSGFISGYQNRYGDNLKPPTNVYHRMTA